VSGDHGNSYFDISTIEGIAEFNAMSLSVPSKETIISAPGKVLFAGGYLVLDRLYSGLVIATSSRFYCYISDLTSDTSSSSPEASSSSSSSTSAEIAVRAGQLPRDSSSWTYTLTLQGEEMRLEPEPGVGRNKFIEITLAKTLSYAWESMIAGGMDSKAAGIELLRRIRGRAGLMEVIVLADNDFYSQREQVSFFTRYIITDLSQLAVRNLPLSISSLSSLPPFCPLPRPIHQTNKTGLGSSASLVTSLVTALLSHLDIIELPSSSQAEALHQGGKPCTAGLNIVHSLAQYAHCLAQGKVGSGFDISSAVYGTHVYRRFSPSLLAPLMEHPSTSVSPSSGLLDALDPKKWDQAVSRFRLPRGFRLMLADVDAGTDTPSFVGKVLTWREREKETALELWTDIGSANDTLGDLLQELCGHEEDPQYGLILEDAGYIPIEECDIARPVSQVLVRIRAALNVCLRRLLSNVKVELIEFQLIRSYLQHMSTLSQVPIEPPSQTRLLDACSSRPGVLGGGVPGAGGFDAIFLLVIDSAEVVKGVEDVWRGWKEMSVCPLLARQSDGGLRRERLEGVLGLRAAIER